MNKVLIIEDEDTIRENIMELLLSEEFQVLDAAQGQLGIKLASEYQPNLILCDIIMPDIDGYTVLTEMQKQPLLANIPFIFMTAKAERRDLRLGMELGADDYITKPFTPIELLSTIRARLKKQQQYLFQYAEERERANQLKQKVSELEQLSKTQEELLTRLSEELSNPMSNISLAVQMLNLLSTQANQVPDLALKQQRYLKILQEECAREVSILNQISDLKTILTPENIKFIRKLNVLQRNNYD
ncbi:MULTISPECIES: ATP-binding response regulator [Planktothrix]|uniref:histidine kinase n=1 Tax=Planktothrix mougeotii LEGE 06226 TaxID=1828728 RepID=A0ABR9UAT2_9CYAN|nr:MULTISPECIES: response regulator [Planktothrix]MBD2484545.1 response regulator [Planktothrix sp. FACHB-1365]MBE9143568.1 response regulator [Planktothrix mougeotii LEGE 06226]